MSRKNANIPASKQKTPKVRAIPTEIRREDLVNDDIEDAELADDWEPEPPPAPTESIEGGEESTALSPEIIIDEDRALSPVSISDPLRQYMKEIRKYALLSPEEERQFANRLRETGDIHAAKALVQANLRLVVKISFEYRSVYSNVLDLIQEGNIGLMKAVSKFDPTKGARLGYYSSWWIRSYILKYLIDNFRLVKIGTTQAQKKLFYHLMREKDRLEAQGFLAGPKLLAERLEVREKDVVEMQQRLSGQGSEIPIDTPTRQDEGAQTPANLLADPHELADEALARSQLLQLLSDQLPAFRQGLKEKELRILEDRLLSEEPKTLQEVADQYGLTRERVRQIESKVIQKLRDFLSPSLQGTRDTKGQRKGRLSE